MITTTQNKPILLINGSRQAWRYEFALAQALHTKWCAHITKAGDLSTPGTIINLNKMLGATDAEIIAAIEDEIAADARLKGMIEMAEAAQAARAERLADLRDNPTDTPEWRQEVADLEMAFHRTHIPAS